GSIDELYLSRTMAGPFRRFERYAELQDAFAAAEDAGHEPRDESSCPTNAEIFISTAASATFELTNAGSDTLPDTPLLPAPESPRATDAALPTLQGKEPAPVPTSGWPEWVRTTLFLTLTGVATFAAGHYLLGWF